MKLDFFKELENSLKRNEINNFITELSNHLSNTKEKNSKLNDLRQENCLYQVVEGRGDSIYLKNTNTDEVFEETNLSDDIKEQIITDSILRYKDGKYIIEEELTDKFFDSLLSIQEYEKIKQDFKSESNIQEFDSNTRFNLLSHEENYSILYSVNDKTNTLKVPNALLPYIVNEKKVLYYDFSSEKFKTDIIATKKNYE